MGTKIVRVKGWAWSRWRARLAERRRVGRSVMLSLGHDQLWLRVVPSEKGAGAG